MPMGLMLIQLILLIAGYLTALLLIGHELALQPDIALILLSGWVISLWLTQKHQPKYYQRKLKYILAPYPKAFIIHLLILVIGALLIQDGRAGMVMMVVIVTIYAGTELLLMLLWIRMRAPGDHHSVLSEITKYAQDDLDLTGNPQPKRIPAEAFQCEFPGDLAEVLSGLYLKTHAMQFVQGSAADFFFGKADQLMQPKASNYSLIALNSRVNDLGQIDTVFKSCYDRLFPGGYFLVSYHNIKDTEELLKKRFPSVLYDFVFPFHWLFYRVLSKIEVFYKIQEFLSRGKNKVISWVEVYGRLAYCGFDVVLEERYNGMQYIIARKTKTISDNPDPSYFMFVRLNRVSLNGNIIKINKVRTMYPYSEFLQKKIFEQNSLQNNGKFKNDPRITPQGKIFRKYWIDELPQLFDWLRGEIKLVGIRAMSQHYFSLYSPRYKDLYMKVKPGIIAPIFDEGTDTFKDIEEVEFTYLESYINHPLKTDWKYFWLTFENIIKGVRSK